jgi:hypothetical protein
MLINIAILNLIHILIMLEYITLLDGLKLTGNIHKQKQLKK